MNAEEIYKKFPLNQALIALRYRYWKVPMRERKDLDIKTALRIHNKYPHKRMVMRNIISSMTGLGDEHIMFEAVIEGKCKN